MRSDYCPMANEPCQSMCDQPCSAQRLKPPAEPVASAWDEGYRAGIDDERMSEANIGIAGFNAKNEPARNNPYRRKSPPAEVPMIIDDEIDDIWMIAREANEYPIGLFARAIEALVRQKAGLK